MVHYSTHLYASPLPTHNLQTKCKYPKDAKLAQQLIASTIVNLKEGTTEINSEQKACSGSNESSASVSHKVSLPYASNVHS